MAESDGTSPVPGSTTTDKISKFFFECAEDLKHFRWVWRNKDRWEEKRRVKEKGREVPPPRFPPSGKPRVIAYPPAPPGVNPLVRVLANTRDLLYTHSIPSVLPHVDQALQDRLLAFISATELEAQVPDLGGENDPPMLRWQQEWHELGLDSEITELVILLRAEGERRALQTASASGTEESEGGSQAPSQTEQSNGGENAEAQNATKGLPQTPDEAREWLVRWSVARRAIWDSCAT